MVRLTKFPNTSTRTLRRRRFAILSREGRSLLDKLGEPALFPEKDQGAWKLSGMGDRSIL